MKKKDVLIFIEHKVREYEVAQILEKELKKKGYSVTIKSTFFDYYKSLFLYSPKVIVTPWLYDDEDVKKFTKFIFNKKGQKIVNLHCEQIGSNNSVKLLLPKGNAKKSFHLSWGKNFTEELEKIEVKKDTILKQGAPFLDFYEKGFKKYSKTKAELGKKYDLDPGKKWILFIGSFGVIDLPDKNLKTLEERGYNNIFEFADLAKKSFSVFIKWIDKFLEENQELELEFIYRPHPSKKNMIELKQLEKKYKNFRVIRGESIRDWIINSDIINNWISTSIVEIIKAGKGCNILRPIEVPESIDIETLKKIPTIKNYEEFCRKNLHGDMKGKDDIKKRLEEFYYMNQNNSIKSIADEIKEIIKNDKGHTFVNEDINLYKTFKRFLKEIIGDLLLKHGIKLKKLDMFKKYSHLNEKI